MSWVHPKIKEEARKIRYGKADNMVAVPSANQLTEPPKAKTALRGYHSAQNFTKFYGSVFCDVPVTLAFDFSNDEFTKEGRYPTDKDLPDLNYDANALMHSYDPQKPMMGSKFLVILYGKWLRVTLEPQGDKCPDTLRVFIRGSVF